MVMSSKGGFWCGLLAAFSWLLFALLMIYLPSHPEGFWQGLSNVIALVTSFLGGLVLTVTAMEADPPK